MARNSIANTFRSYIRTAVVVILGTAAIHMLVMGIEFLFVESIQLNLKSDFLGAVFSSPMLPVIFAYGVLLASMNYLWNRTKREMERAYQFELELEKQNVVREALQKLAIELSEDIVAHNSEILKWIDLQKTRNGQVSERVEQASRAIAENMARMTERAFVQVYHDPAGVLRELEEERKERPGVPTGS